MKALISKMALAAAALLLLLAGCDEAPDGSTGLQGTSQQPDATTFTIETDVGRAVCVWAKTGYGGGLSCVWPAAERMTSPPWTPQGE